MERAQESRITYGERNLGGVENKNVESQTREMLEVLDEVPFFA